REALTLRVLKAPRLDPAGAADRDGDGVAFLRDVDLRAPGRQPLRDERGNCRHRAALLPAADRLQFPALVGAGLIVDIKTGCAVAIEEGRSREVDRQDDSPPSQRHAVAVAVAGSEGDGARAPALV